jgi:hypothetical protein
MRKQSLKLLAVSAAALAAATFGVVSANAGGLEDIFKVSAEGNKLAKASQTRIDALTDQTAKLLGDYKIVAKEVEGLRIYNARQQRQINSQNKEMNDLRGSISRITSIQRQITPLMVKMVEGLDSFIKLDMPFEMEERTNRVALLRETLDRSDVSRPEKLRSIFEAYQIESEYGRRISAKTGAVTIDGRELEGNILRIGRVGLYFMTVDSSTLAMWNTVSNSWQSLDSEHRSALTQAIRIANQQTAPSLVRLPLIAPN